MITESIKAETEAELEDKIKRYLADWSPQGYGTTVVGRGQNPETGEWSATFRRGTSAD